MIALTIKMKYLKIRFYKKASPYIFARNIIILKFEFCKSKCNDWQNSVHSLTVPVLLVVAIFHHQYFSKQAIGVTP